MSLSTSTQYLANPCCTLVCAEPSPLIVRELADALTTGVEPIVILAAVLSPVIVFVTNVLMLSLRDAITDQM